MRKSMSLLRKLKLCALLIFGVHTKAMAFPSDKQGPKAPVMYFDLGDTVIDTKDSKHMHYFTGALQYLEELKAKGYKVGLITNIPETFGEDYDKKIATLKKYIADNWTDDVPFNWEIFDDIIVPMKNSEMKPSPIMFEKAISRSESCPISYISENPKEVVAAGNLGLATHLFKTGDANVYVPINNLKNFFKDNFHRQYDEECFKNIYTE